MLVAEPFPVSNNCLETWRRLGPLSIETFIKLSPEDYYLEDIWKESRFTHWDIKVERRGMCSKDEKDSKHGIVRIVSKMGGVFEGTYYENRKQGYGREIFADG